MGRNVCGIRQRSSGYWWQSNLDHGTGWTGVLRQAWTLREANLEYRKMIERGWAGEDVEIVELGPKVAGLV